MTFVQALNMALQSIIYHYALGYNTFLLMFQFSPGSGAPLCHSYYLCCTWAVSSHFLVVRDANSLRLPQRVAKALPNSSAGEQAGKMSRLKTQQLVFGEEMRSKEPS